MTPEQDEVIDRMKSLIEAVGIVRSSLLDRIEAVAYHYDPAALQGELREVRAALNEIRSAVLTLSMDLMEGEGDPCGCVRADTNDMPGSLSRDGVEDTTPEVRPLVEHGDEVAF